jgi:hypothetical protein
VPIAEVQAAQAFESSLYNCAQDLFRWRILIERRAHGLEFGCAHRLPDDFGIETCLISEVVVDGGNVCTCSIADFSDSGVMETDFSEHFTGSVD